MAGRPEGIGLSLGAAAGNPVKVFFPPWRWQPRAVRSACVRHAWILASVLGVAGAASAETRSAGQFADWRALNEPTVAAFQAHLKEQGLDDVAPLHELLRTASDWEPCNAQPFAVPPAPQWLAAASVLRLLKELQALGILGDFEVHSAYRDEALNRCAGGATRSTHLVAYAVDISPRDGSDPGDALCAFWRRQGRQWQMGLGRYPSGRIHVDTWRHRSWGADPSGHTSFCVLAD